MIDKIMRADANLTNDPQVFPILCFRIFRVGLLSKIAWENIEKEMLLISIN